MHACPADTAASHLVTASRRITDRQRGTASVGDVRRR